MWAFLGLSGAAGGGFVRVREVLAGFGRFVGVFGRVRSVWGRAGPVGDVLLMVFFAGQVGVGSDPPRPRGTYKYEW